MSSTTRIVFAFALYERAEILARSFTLRFSLKSQLWGLGPKIVPPPLYNGFRMFPLRDPPVPFCLCNFLEDPLTSIRVFTLWVPCLWAARYCFTARYMT